MVPHGRLDLHRSVHRALLIWEFDIELDRGYESNLSVEHPFYGRVYYLEREGRPLDRNPVHERSA